MYVHICMYISVYMFMCLFIYLGIHLFMQCVMLLEPLFSRAEHNETAETKQ